MSGWDVLERLSEWGNEVCPPVVLLTALDLRKELDHVGDRLLRIRRRRPLTMDEMEHVLPVLLQSLRPLYPATAESREQTEGPLA